MKEAKEKKLLRLQESIRDVLRHRKLAELEDLVRRYLDMITPEVTNQGAKVATGPRKSSAKQ